MFMFHRPPLSNRKVSATLFQALKASKSDSSSLLKKWKKQNRVNTFAQSKYPPSTCWQGYTDQGTATFPIGLSTLSQLRTYFSKIKVPLGQMI